MAITPLCKSLTESPQANASSHYTKAVLLDTAAKVCMIATALIGVGLFAMSIGMAPIATLPLSLALIAIFGSIALMPLAAKLQSLANREYALSDIEYKVAEQLSSIESWTEENIRAFLQEHNIDPARLPLPSLSARNPQEPLKALLPLIARARAWQELYISYLNSVNQNLAFANPEGKEELLVLEVEHKNMGWTILESKALPAAFEIAASLENIQRPTEELSLSSLGTMTQRPFLVRIIEQLAHRNRVYFTFSAEGKTPLHLGQFEEFPNCDPRQIRSLLFA